MGGKKSEDRRMKKRKPVVELDLSTAGSETNRERRRGGGEQDYEQAICMNGMKKPTGSLKGGVNIRLGIQVSEREDVA